MFGAEKKINKMYQMYPHLGLLQLHSAGIHWHSPFTHTHTHIHKSFTTAQVSFHFLTETPPFKHRHTHTCQFELSILFLSLLPTSTSSFSSPVSPFFLSFQLPLSTFSLPLLPLPAYTSTLSPPFILPSFQCSLPLPFDPVHSLPPSSLSSLSSLHPSLPPFLSLSLFFDPIHPLYQPGL